MTVKLNEGQTKAIDTILDFLIDPQQKEIVLAGSAGTGKSTVVKYLIESISKQKELVKTVLKTKSENLDIIVTATTNKAARVIANITQTSPSTIHSTLGLTIKNDFKTGKVNLSPSKSYEILEDKILIIDESSFIDIGLLNWIRKSTRNCKIIYVGDPYQLAPVKSATIPPVFTSVENQVLLTEVMRNKGDISRISTEYKETVNTGSFPSYMIGKDNVLHANGEEFQTLIDEEFSKEDPNSRILAWSNDCVHLYNNYIRGLNSLGEELTEGEKVITNKPIMSGNISISTDTIVSVTNVSELSTDRGVEGHYIELEGVIEIFVPLNQADAKKLCKGYASNKEWSDYFYIKNNWGDLRPIYACTVHKSQGSTYDKVFIDLDDIGRCNIPSDVARLLYVAISRAAKKVILYGSLPEKYGTILT